jgi:hypothetical protein
MAYNLLVDSPDTSNFEYVLEEKNLKSGQEPTLHIEGPYLMAGDVNRNGRVYDAEEMETEVLRYTEKMVDQNRAMGELNHPTSAEVDLERACHIVVELARRDDPNIWYGKSKILSTPCGKIVKSLVMDGVKVGVSSRSLGQLEARNDGVNQVKDMRLVAIDCVADPSYTDAFVDGILESKKWVCEDGKFVEVYDTLEEGLETLPKKDVAEYVSKQLVEFINKIKNNT